MTNSQGQWCSAINGVCVEGSGVIDTPTSIIDTLTTKYNDKTAQCQKELDDLQNKVSQEQKTVNGKSISAGPCITPQGQWGIIIPEFGRNCVAPVVQPTPTQPPGTPGTPSTPAPITPPPNMVNLTRCLPKNTDFNQECRDKYGDKPLINARGNDSEYGMRKLYDCADPTLKQAFCDIGYDNGYHVNPTTTKCYPVANAYPNFDFHCQELLGRGDAGYVKLLNGRQYGCADGYARAQCSADYRRGHNLYPNLTPCESLTNIRKICGDKYTQLDGYNCYPTFYRAKCNSNK